MNDSDTKQGGLLPSGFVDLLPPQAEQEAQAISILIDTFLKSGYERIKPPLAEFEESLLGQGPGATIAADTFRLMDPVSHRMLGLRSDITAQVSRIAFSRLRDEARPLRLCYANDVLRIKGSQQRTERQYCQAGCEIIGYEDEQADIEIAVLAVLGLKAAGLTSLTLDLALPGIVESVFEALSVAGEAGARYRAALDLRDTDAFNGTDEIELILKALLNNGGGFEVLKAVDMPDSVKVDIQALEVIYTGILRALAELEIDDINVSVDFIEHRGFEYHKQFGFTVFADGIHGELGRGGRYDVCFDNAGSLQKETATGFTLYMDTVQRGIKPSVKPKCLFLSPSESWHTVKAMQDEGWRVVRGDIQDVPPKRCSHIYKDGEIERI